MTTYLVATNEPPTIVCPDWCDHTTEDHINELNGWEGCVVHVGYLGGQPHEVSLGCTLLPNGSPKVATAIAIGGNDCTLEEAITLAAALQTAIRIVQQETKQ